MPPRRIGPSATKGYDRPGLVSREERLRAAALILGGMVASGDVTRSQKDALAREALEWADVLVAQVNE